ncbi:MAG: FkbM family methyltransferase [Ruminiclostridium sp.]|nr:FkbM family methyltransferase [Ruminiclostridium sp.]
MSGLKDRLVYRENRVLGMLERLSACRHPIGLIGGGTYARTLCEALPRFGITPSFIVLDEKYMNKSGMTICSLPVISPGECASRCPDAHLIIAYNYRHENELTVIKKEMLKFTPDTYIYALGTVFLNELDWMPYEYILGNITGFEETYDMLEDALSQRIMAEFLNARISGDAGMMHVFDGDSDNDYDPDLLFGNDRKGVIVECGAFDGKSALQTDEYFSGSRKIYALEPVGAAFEKMCRSVSGHKSIIPIKKGTGDKECAAYISGSDGTAAVSENGSGERIEITTIDALLGDETAAVITMDIEGSEVSALKGAKNVIIRDHPALAVRIYHKCDDLLTIPKLIESLSGGGYKYYLRINNPNIGTYDVTLYAV